jgi:hypothetical protein
MNQEPRPKDPLRAFTLVGRLLVLVTLLLGGGLFAWIVLYAKDRMPDGGYPIAFILIPVVIGAAIFFVLAELFLRLFGIRVWSATDDPGPQGTPPNGGPTTLSGNGVGSGRPPSVS